MDLSLYQLEKNLYYYRECFCRNFENKIEKHRLKELVQFIYTQCSVEEDIFEFRIRKILETEEPYLPPVNCELYQKINPTKHIGIDEITENYLQIKQRIYNYLNSLSGKQLSRYGYHWKEGHISLEELLKRYIENDMKRRNKIDCFFTN